MDQELRSSPSVSVSVIILITGLGDLPSWGGIIDIIFTRNLRKYNAYTGSPPKQITQARDSDMIVTRAKNIIRGLSMYGLYETFQYESILLREAKRYFLGLNSDL